MEFAQDFGSSDRVCTAKTTLVTGGAGVQTAELREAFTDVTESCLATLNATFLHFLCTEN